MPTYQNKKRLERYLERHGEADALTRYLILSGYSEEVVKVGLLWFVERWEEAVDWLVKGFDCIEEWTHDLYARELLDDALANYTGTLPQGLKDRIEIADARLRAATRETSCCVWSSGFNVDLGRYDPVRYWYYFRWPKDQGSR